MLAKITSVVERYYSDNGMTKTYVSWVDGRGKAGRTEGSADNTHMKALIDRAAREGVALLKESW